MWSSRIHLTFQDLIDSTSLTHSTNRIWRISRVGAWTSSDWVSCGLVSNQRKDNTTRLICRPWRDWCLWLANMASILSLSSIRTCLVRNFVQMVCHCGLFQKPYQMDSHYPYRRQHHLTRQRDFQIGILAASTHGESFTPHLQSIRDLVLFTITSTSCSINSPSIGCRLLEPSKTILTFWPTNS